MAERLFASSASPHRGPDSAVLSPKQRTSRHIDSVLYLSILSGGPALGSASEVEGFPIAGPPTAWDKATRVPPEIERRCFR
jgi:hypothetical protein